VTNLTSATNKEARAKGATVQPYMTCVEGQGRNKRDASLFVNCDGSLLAVSTTEPPLVAFDLLFKAFFVFSVKFPPSLKNVFNFVEKHVYKMSVAAAPAVASLEESEEDLM